MKRILAIDPGASGAMVYSDDGFIISFNMPKGMTAQVDLIGEYIVDEIVMEKVGGYRPGNSGPAAVKFARHVGNLEAAIYTLKIPVKLVAPNVWMKSLGIHAKDKAERKREIRELMQRTYPKIKVTLSNADALGILTWYLEKGG